MSIILFQHFKNTNTYNVTKTRHILEYSLKHLAPSRGCSLLLHCAIVFVYFHQMVILKLKSFENLTTAAAKETKDWNILMMVVIDTRGLVFVTSSMKKKCRSMVRTIGCEFTGSCKRCSNICPIKSFRKEQKISLLEGYKSHLAQRWKKPNKKQIYIYE